ncbi:glycosyltransferase [Micromonospora sp. WMMA1923]|uniref:glycosyltransferase n=1 Tax=Micromonospora sp. WMMA1923 TaxID=3404125 RepID=UPI003B93FF2F
MRVGLVPGVWSYGLGSVSTVLAVHEAVRHAGHTPVLFAAPHFQPILDRLGVPAVPIPGPTRAAYPDDPVLRLDDLLSRSAYADRDLVETVLAAQLRQFREYDVQVLFHDYDLTTVVAGALAGIPVVSPVTWPDHLSFGRGSDGWQPMDTRALAAFRPALRRTRHPEAMSLSEVLFDWSTRLVYPLTPRMDPLVGLHSTGEYLGPLTATTLDRGLAAGPPDWPRPGHTGVLAYSSGPPMDADWYRRHCLAAFEGTTVDVLIAAGRSDGAGPRVSPAANVQLWPLLPLRDLLGRAGALICHGGRGTLASGVRAGVPLIVFAGGDPEREYFADMLARQGLAANCAADDWRPERLRHLVRQAAAARAARTTPAPVTPTGAGLAGAGLTTAAGLTAGGSATRGAARVVEIMQELTATPSRLAVLAR